MAGATPDERFIDGRLRCRDGANAGIDARITAVDGGALVLLEGLPFAPISGGRVELREGCDKRLATCSGRFANAANFRGEPHVPGGDVLTRFPGVMTMHSRHAAIVAAVRACVGTRFRAQGRCPGIALDCVGVALVAAARSRDADFVAPAALYARRRQRSPARCRDRRARWGSHRRTRWRLTSSSSRRPMRGGISRSSPRLASSMPMPVSGASSRVRSTRTGQSSPHGASRRYKRWRHWFSGTIGRVIGGPIGGLVGTVIGGSIDRGLFGGAAREGPRVANLAVQSAAYGEPLPRLYGRMRVAGNLVWTAGIKETRTRTGGGKGGSATNNYSYSSSFAVIVAARSIVRVERIWADGKLLRASDGTLNFPAKFRVHPAARGRQSIP